MNGFTTLRLQIVSNTLLGLFLMTMSFVLSFQTNDNLLIVANEGDRGLSKFIIINITNPNFAT